MNTKEKLLYIASSDYIEKLKQNDLDFENHNRLFWCHLASISFLTSGISDFNLDLNYSYLLSSTGATQKELGLKFDTGSVSFITTNNALIEFNLRSTRNGLKLNNPVFGALRCFDFKNAMEKYINDNLKYKDMTYKEYEEYNFNTLFLKFRIYNRKSEETQENFLKLLTEQCPEIDYFLSYIKAKDKLPQKNPATYVKKLKI